MNDTFLDISMVLIALAMIHIGLGRQAYMNVQRQAALLFNGSALIHVDIEPRGFFGFEVNDLESISIETSHVVLNRPPLYRFPKSGWKGSIHHLSVKLHDLTVSGYPVKEFAADIPSLTYDLGYAYYQGRLVVRDAGRGTGEIVLSSADLHDFIAKKYRGLFSDFSVTILPNQEIHLRGQLNFLGEQLPVDIRSKLTIVTPTAIGLTGAVVRLNGRLLDPSQTALLLTRINPVVDLASDLGVGDFFMIDDLQCRSEMLIVRGSCLLPEASAGQRP